jgi:hypothetical protein
LKEIKKFEKDLEEVQKVGIVREHCQDQVLPTDPKGYNVRAGYDCSLALYMEI